MPDNAGEIIKNYNLIKLKILYVQISICYNIIFEQFTQNANMQNRFKIKPMLSWTPTKATESIYRLKPRFAGNSKNLPEIEIRERLVDSSRGISFSPRKGKPSTLGLFKNAHKIGSLETFLPAEKGLMQSNTNESSSPMNSLGRGHKLTQPIHCAKNDRSMSTSNSPRILIQKGKVIQRTVSIVIDGKNAQVKNKNELITTLSKIIMGEESGNQKFMIEFLGQSSIHGEEDNFLEMDSHYFTHMIPQQEDSFSEI